MDGRDDLLDLRLKAPAVRDGRVEPQRQLRGVLIHLDLKDSVDLLASRHDL